MYVCFCGPACQPGLWILKSLIVFLLGLQVGTGELLQLNHVSGGLSDLFFTGPAGGDIDGLPTLAAGVRSTPAVGRDQVLVVTVTVSKTLGCIDAF